MRDYEVTAELGRAGHWWVLSVPDVPGAHSQARGLSHAEDTARELIALMTDADPGTFTVHLDVILPDDVRSALDECAALRAEAARAQARAAQLSRTAARSLRDHGLPLRDIGTALGVSVQRAKQLVDEAAS